MAVRVDAGQGTSTVGNLASSAYALGEAVERLNDLDRDPNPAGLAASRSCENARVLQLLDGSLGCGKRHPSVAST